MEGKARKPFSRLPLDVRPTNYDLHLTPNLQEFTFSGSLKIDVEVSKSTKTVVLNSAEIEVQKATAVVEGKEFTASISYEADDEKLAVEFNEDLPVGKGSIDMKFTGILNDKMRGFYRSSYTTPSGEKRTAAVTQFEATDARRAFPCWDEPAVKASFDVTLTAPNDLTTLSNMPEEDVTSKGDLKTVRFQRTPIMSTYLLAFVVGEFDYVEGLDADGIQVRVYTPVGRKEEGTFALDVAVKTLPFYKDYFKIAYPLPKMDLIAIPDFAAGAMENWGLVTYRETALLVHPTSSSAASRQWVALVVGHELAHQWFGNLVTMEWWTHLWLNEGFASWIEYLCVDFCFPEYDIWTQFASTDFGRFLELDALKSSHPIEVEVGHPSEVDEIFDAISYSKGASVIRMLHQWLGDESFRAGLQDYLKTFQYSNASTGDLWTHLEQASKKPVSKVMSAWTSQIGFPLLKVSQKIEGERRVLSITQERFLADGSTDESGMVWPVPVQVCTQSAPEKVALTQLITERSAEIVLEDVDPTHWVKINAGSVGCYRVQYSPDMLESLRAGLKEKQLSPRDRLALQSDLFALAQAGRASITDYLNTIKVLSDEDNYTVWSELSSALVWARKQCQWLDCEQELHGFCRQLYSPLAARLGWQPQDGESHLTSMLRGLALRWLGRTEEEETVSEARRKFDLHVKGDELIPADLRIAVYSTVLQNHGKDVFEDMLNLYRKSDNQEEKVRILRSLGSVTDSELLTRTLDFSLSEEVRSQDAMFAVAGCVDSKPGRQITFDFMKKNWKLLNERFQGLFILGRIVKCACGDFASDEAAKEMEEFFAANPCPNAERSITQAVESVRLNAACLKRDAEQLKTFLKQ